MNITVARIAPAIFAEVIKGVSGAGVSVCRDSPSASGDLYGFSGIVPVTVNIKPHQDKKPGVKNCENP